jgi:hypothetical protein
MTNQNQYLPYITDSKLEAAVSNVLSAFRKAQGTTDIHKNIIDPFSALFEVSLSSISYDKWIEKEKIRQAQKSLQNSIGYFHQEILGNLNGWQNLGVGQTIDICNPNKRIIAEIKNKYNTTKGSDKVRIYDTLLDSLSRPKYHQFTAYYVEIIPSSKKHYNDCFTPSDNKTKQPRPRNEKIRKISGQDFYDLATDCEQSLKMLFDVLPKVISNLTSSTELSSSEKFAFQELFNKAF